MLNVKIVTIGGLRESYLREAAAEYEKRCRPYCKLSVIELKSETALAGALEDKNYKIALCVEGKELSSPELSALIGKAAVQGGGGVTFVIGGADGLDEKSKQLCDFRLSFSKMTFPHQLMRVILTEQLYRALNISAGGHYHH